MNFPKNWINVKFEDIAECITDRIDKPSESGLDDYIGLDQLDTDQIRIKRFASTADFNATKFLCKKGDIIFGKRNAYLRKVGVSDRDAVVSAHSMVLRPIGKLIDPNFLPCLLQSSTFWKIAFSISEGSMSPTIKWKIIAKQELMIPPLEEQKKISNLLWAIEENIEKTETLISINEKLKKGVINELLTKGIGHKKFKKTEIGEIPEEWKLGNLGDVTDITDGSHLSPKEFFGKSDKYIATVKDMTKDCFDYSRCKKISEEEYKKLVRNSNSPEDNDVLFSKDGTIGTTFVYKKERPLVLLSSIAIIKPSDKIDPRYIRELLKSSIFYNQIEVLKSGTAIRRITLISLKKFLITLPPIEEQKKLIKLIIPLYKSVNNLDLNLVKLNNLKKKLTDEILKGNVKI